ncbi:transmembrane protease serine 11G-like [Diorhabda carinulata]|uniref:transmembrane protease serine 11G-like n=1 Tax=Diorhabda carinulata TaxID=1163345 RepID=UPI00259FED60|nr:transmembrane protease serine 11G-like [Diorhabda carinulata]XP_057658523.1 transmembrane protease serine 11G-like [Diorhabda carinulata]
MMILYILMIVYLSNEVAAQVDFDSPCSDIFHYENQTESNRWFGVISIRTLEDLTGVWITVILDRRAELLGNWFGESFTTDNKEFRITNPNYVLEAGPPVSVRFFVQYSPTDRTIPKLETIRLNGKTICSRNSTEHKNVPTLHLSKPTPTAIHTSNGGNREYYTSNTDKVYVSTESTSFSGTRRPSVNSNDDNYNAITRPQITGTGANIDRNDYNREPQTQKTGGNIRDSNRNTYSDNSKSNQLSTKDDNRGHSKKETDTNRISHVPLNAEDDFFQGDFHVPNDSDIQRYNNSKKQQHQLGVSCGSVVARPKPLISFGQDTTPGEWPWHAAVYRTKGIQLIYICGGTVISENHILTAAHCVTKARSKTSVDPQSLLVYLGKYNLKSFGAETQDRDVENIQIHPDFNSSTFYNDIAILKLSRPIEITDFVRPVCLWEGDTNLEYLTNKEGTVIGWGFNEKRALSEKLMQAKMPIVSTIKCIYSNREFFSRFTFEKNYCAGFRNGTSVCNGDSGGSMVFPKRGTSGQNTIWQIRGLVSVGVALQTEGVCDTSQYIIFTDVAKHLSWIRQIMNSNNK